MLFFERVHQLLERLARIAVWMGGGALMLSAIMVTIDVLSRKLLSITMSGSDEISGYVFAASTTWAYSYCLLHRSNVRIDAFYTLLPRPLRAVLDIIGLALLLYFMSFLTRTAIDVFLTSWEHNSVAITTLATPLWIPQLFWVAGLAMFVLTAGFVLVYALVALFRGDMNRVQRVAGAMNVEEEIGETIHGMDVSKSGRGEL